MNIFNQFSYPIISVLLLLGTFWLLRTILKQSLRRTIPVLLGIAALALTGFIILRPGNNNIDSLEDIEFVLENGKPTFIEFFSNYCAGCIAFQPMVDQIIDQIDSDVNILRIDIHSALGREIRRQYTFTFTPEYVIFDQNGDEIWRDHIPPSIELFNIPSET